MKITMVKPIRVNRYCFVKIYTDEGITGLGESGAFGALDASAEQIKRFGDYLIGKDPLDIEHHWQVMFRGMFFRGAAIMGAISAIDIALWDIAGKYYNAPIYKLIGGKTREKVRVYCHVFAKSDEELVENLKKRCDEGYNAIGHLSPFLDESRHMPYEKTHVQNINESLNRVALMRETVGNNVDLCIEMHRRLSPGEAIVLINKLDDYNPLFVEDPISPGNNSSMAYVAKNTKIPIATGERLFSIYEFQDLMEKKACSYIRTSVTLCGGITGTLKIAAIAEAHMCQIIPHNPLTPVATAACLQICASVDNLLINEYPDPQKKLINSDGKVKDIVKNYHKPINGYIEIPNGVGLDIELIDNVEKLFIPVDTHSDSRLNIDGSVRDQ